MFEHVFFVKIGNDLKHPCEQNQKLIAILAGWSET